MVLTSSWALITERETLQLYSLNKQSYGSRSNHDMTDKSEGDRYNRIDIW